MSELAEGARLEIACTTKSGTGGSNPPLSATHSRKERNGLPWPPARSLRLGERALPGIRCCWRNISGARSVELGSKKGLGQGEMEW